MNIFNINKEIINNSPAEFAIAVAEAVKSALCKGDSQLLSAKEAATLIGVSRSTWYSLKSEGRVPAPIQLGKRVLWRREEVLAWVKAGCPDTCSWEKKSSRKTLF